MRWDDYDFVSHLVVRAAVWRWGGWNAVRSRRDSNGGVWDTMSTTGETSTSTTGITTTMTTAGVTTMTTTGVTTSVTTTGVTFLSLVVLSYLEALLNVAQFNTNDPFLIMWDTVDWSRGAVMGRNTMTTMTRRRRRVSLVLNFVLQNNMLDFFK